MRSAPMVREAKRARKSALPQAKAVARPSRTPMARLRRLAFFHLQAKFGHDFLQISPDFAFRRRIPQKISRMISSNKFSPAKFLPFASKMGNSAVCLQNSLCSRRSQAHYHFWRDRINLPEKKWRTLRNFVVFWLAVLRRAAFHNVADINVFALQAHGFNHLRQELSRASDKWKALLVFVCTRAFPDENQFRLGIAVAKDNAMARLVQPAAFAIA